MFLDVLNLLTMNPKEGQNSVIIVLFTLWGCSEATLASKAHVTESKSQKFMLPMAAAGLSGADLFTTVRAWRYAGQGESF